MQTRVMELYNSRCVSTDLPIDYFLGVWGQLNVNQKREQLDVL